MFLNRSECQVLRGLAILSIVLHNFSHFLKWAAHENEFYFFPENDAYFYNHVISLKFVAHFFSYYGHLGVPVFVFLTGYGLTVKYSNNREQFVGWVSFIVSHFKKLFSPMLIGVISFYVIYYLLNARLWDGWLVSLSTQLTMTSNLLPHPNFVIHPGPYWYFGLTMQLYVLYSFVIYKRKTYVFIFIVLVSFFLLLLLKSHYYLLVWFKYNFIGWLLPFAGGIVMGNIQSQSHVIKNRCIWGGIIAVSASIILWSGGWYYTWLMIPVFSVLFFIGICKLLTGCAYKACMFLGDISMFIFVVHPIVREIVLTLMPFSQWYVNLFLYFMGVVLCSLFFSRVYSKVERHLVAK